MREILQKREEKIREFLNLQAGAKLLNENLELPQISPAIEEHLQKFNLEWHVIPTQGSIPLDEDAYGQRFYAMYKGEAKQSEYQKTSSYRAISNGHRQHQGRVVAIETTMKPRYLPIGKQFYGTPYGFESLADPFAPYFGKARMVNETRYGHNFRSLTEFVNVVNADWHRRGLMPPGFRLTICPPVIFNFIGTIFHPEWSDTESLELGFYRDDRGNAKCFAVGSNAPGDFSYFYEIGVDSDWGHLGFRTALVPGEPN